MKNPLVSIIIPVYNCEKYIYESVSSALKQTWMNKEIIIVDNKSTDKTIQIIKSFKSDIINLYSIEKRNACLARNYGFKQSKGSLIQFLDADDCLASDKIEKQVALLSKFNNYNYISSGKWVKFCKNTPKRIFKRDSLWKDMNPIDFLVEAYSNNLMMHPAAWLAPRSLIEGAGGWDETIKSNQDGEFFARVLLKSEKVVFCEDSISYYRKGIIGSISSVKTLSVMRSRYNSLEKCSSYILAREKSIRAYYACASLFKIFMYAVYPTSKDLYLLAKEKTILFGGSSIAPHGNSLFRFLCRCFGWRFMVKLREKLNLMGLTKIKYLFEIFRQFFF